jgi:sigma-B regulation protein RsbU (phosphoserine phosphatase)
VAVFYEAARQVGGDFYDFVEGLADPNSVGLYIGDVTGKGVPAALQMARSSTMIRSIALETPSPAATLARVNDLIMQYDHSDLFLTALYARLDTNTGRLVYANGGHCRPLWYRADRGDCVELDARGMIMGAFKGIELEEGSVDLGPGDLLFLYTDGVTEAMDGSGRLFGENRLHAALNADCTAPVSEIIDSVVSAVRAHADGVGQFDDLAILALRRLPNNALTPASPEQSGSGPNPSPPA